MKNMRLSVLTVAAAAAVGTAFWLFALHVSFPQPEPPKVAADIGRDTNHVILGWSAAPAPKIVALLATQSGPRSRLLSAIGATNLGKIDSLVARLDALRPALAAESNQPAARRVIIDIVLADNVSRGALLAEIASDASEALRQVRLEAAQNHPNSSHVDLNKQSRQKLILDLENRTEIFRQLSAGFHESTRFAPAAVLTNSAEIITFFGTVATQCGYVVDTLSQLCAPLRGEEAATTTPCSDDGGRWDSPFKDRNSVFFGSFPAELRSHLDDLKGYLPGPVSTNGTSPTSVPSTWVERVLVERVQLSRLRLKIDSTASAWESHLAALRAARQPGDTANLKSLSGALKRSCEQDLADLRDIEDRCVRISADSAPKDWRDAYVTVAATTRNASLQLEVVVSELGKIEGPSETVQATDASGSAPSANKISSALRKSLRNE